ncbi:MAG: ribosome-associated translation inhibitor RaiA [Planctomycetales bacterium]
MQVAIACRHGSIRPDAEDYVRRKAEKLVTYFERVTAIQVTVDFAKDRVSVEIVVDAEHRHNFVAEATGDDVPSTFDRALAKMEQQIRRHKERIQGHRRDRGAGEAVAGRSESEAAAAEDQIDDDDESSRSSE